MMPLRTLVARLPQEPVRPSRSELQSAARALYRKTLFDNDAELLAAVNNVVACINYETPFRAALVEVASDLEGPAPELSAITDWSAA